MSRGLSRAYDGLDGEPLIARLADDGQITILEAMWRVREPELMVRLAAVFAASGSQRLGDLLAAEVMSGSLDNVAISIMAALGAHAPGLTFRAADNLAQRLRDPDALQGPFETQRPQLERWMASQDSRAGVDFAVEVIAGATPQAGDGAVREAALAHARRDADLQRRAAARLREILTERADAPAWASAQEFVEATSEADAAAPAESVALVSAMLALAPELAPVPAFTPVVGAIAAKKGYPTIKERFGGDPIEAAPGATALVGTVDQLRRPTQRIALIRLVLTRHPNLVPALVGQANAWGAEKWRQTLGGLRGVTDDAPLDGLIALLSAAPPSLSELIVDVTARFAHRDERPRLAQVAGERVDQRLAVLRTQGADLTRALPWSRAKENPSFVRDVLAQAVTSADEAADLIAAAVVAKRLGAATAAQILQAGEVTRFVSGLDQLPAPSRRRAFVALAELHDEEMLEVARTRQAAAFDPDLLVAIAPQDELVAFTNADQAYAQLDEQARDDLLAMLEKHGTWASESVLRLFATDTRQSERLRRERAFRRLGDMAPQGQRLPAYFADAISAPAANVRTAALDAIAAAGPADLDLVRRLTPFLMTPGPMKAKVAAVLDDLVTHYRERLDKEQSKEERIALLQLLGAAGRPASVAPLLAHVGADADDDDLTIHQAAAQALGEAAQIVAFNHQEVERLGVVLTNGEEAHPEVLNALGVALSRATLGEDQALEVLYGIVGFAPKKTPYQLFGDEKERIVRHVGLFKSEESRGEASWPQQIEQLDLVAEGLVRAAYREVGTSEPLKEDIRSGDPKRPDYGSLLGALGSVPRLVNAEAPLKVLHDLRSTKTEYTHVGEKPSAADLTTAKESFVTGSKICLGILNN